MIKLIKQIVRFGFVGGICFLVDFLLMILFTEVCHWKYLVSACISFIISTIINYLLSIWFVFKSREDLDKKVEFLVYAILSLVGLGLTELFMWVGVEKANINYMITKIIVTAVVMVYNFITRKLFLEKNKSEEKAE